MVLRRRYLWDPFEELRRVEDWMDRMFREPYYRRALPETAGEELAETTTPYVDIKDGVLQIELPKIEGEEVKKIEVK